MQTFNKILRSRWTLPVVGLVIGLAAVFFLWDRVAPHTFAGTLMQSPQQVYDFTLTGTDGQPVAMHSLQGKYILLFFGYTSCPDICPTTLREMKAVLNDLGGKAGQVQPVFISVDPEKDTPQRLKAYLNNIDPRIMGLTGDLDSITGTASQYGIFFQKRPYGTAGDYLVDHTATMLLVDPKGFLRVVYPYGTDPGAVAGDLRYLMKH